MRGSAKRSGGCSGSGVCRSSTSRGLRVVESDVRNCSRHNIKLRFSAGSSLIDIEWSENYEVRVLIAEKAWPILAWFCDKPRLFYNYSTRVKSIAQRAGLITHLASRGAWALDQGRRISLATCS